MNSVLNLLHGVGAQNTPQTNQNGSKVNGILGMFNLFKNSANPDQTLNQMVSQDPDFKNVVDMINNQYNGDGKAAFYAKAKEMGINPEFVLGLLK